MSSKKNTKSNELTAQQKRQAQLMQMKKNDPALLKEDIFRLKQQLRNIVSIKNEIQSEIKNNKDRNVKQTSEIEKLLKKEEGNLIDIQNKYNELLKRNRNQIASLTKKYDKQQESTQQKYQREVNKKIKEVDNIKQKVQYLKKYPQRKKKYLQNLQQLNARLTKMKLQQEKDINNIRNQHQQQRKKQQKQTYTQIQKIKEFEVNRLEQKMTREQFIKKQNQVMIAQISLCQQQIQMLSTECQQLNKQIQIEKNQIDNNTLGNQANQTYQRSLRIIKLQGKLTKLKSYLSQQSIKLDKQYEDLDNVYSKQHLQLQSKISKIQGWLRIKQRDLKKVKACSQMVLNQRSNLEAYLLQVFYQHPEVDCKDQRNINKILRFLFSKINSKKPPMSYKNFLPENTKSISDSSFRA